MNTKFSGSRIIRQAECSLFVSCKSSWPSDESEQQDRDEDFIVLWLWLLLQRAGRDEGEVRSVGRQVSNFEPVCVCG